jgi:hypothetical protein
MAYTICDQYGMPKPLRLLVERANGEIHLAAEFTPYWWTCDPCNHSSRRYEIEHRVDQNKPTGYPWYQVVTTDDSQADIDMKIAHYGKVIAASKAMDEARREYERLNGGR